MTTIVIKENVCSVCALYPARESQITLETEKYIDLGKFRKKSIDAEKKRVKWDAQGMIQEHHFHLRNPEM